MFRGKAVGHLLVCGDARPPGRGDAGRPHHHQPGGHDDLQPGRHVLHRAARRPGDGRGRVPGLPVVQPAHGPGQPVRPGRQQPHLPHDGRAEPRGDQVRLRVQHLGRRGGDAAVLPGDLSCAQAAVGVPRRELGHLRLRGGLPALGRGAGRRAHDGEPCAGPPAAQRGPRPAGQRGHDVRRPAERGAGPPADLRLPPGGRGRRDRHRRLQRRLRGVFRRAVRPPGGEDQRLPASARHLLPLRAADLLRGPGLGAGHGPGQCLQHGDGAPGLRLRGHPGGGLRHRQAH